MFSEKQTTRSSRSRWLFVALAAALAALLALSTVVDPAEAKKKATGDKIVFVSDRTTGKGVDNPEGDSEVYVMNALDGSGRKNLTNNGGGVHDFSPEWGGQAKKK